MILITGGLGFIGLHTARAFLAAGEDVVLTRFHTQREPSFLTPYLGQRAFIEAVDVTNPDQLLAAGRRYHLTGLIHLAGAAISGLSPAEGLRATALSTLNVLEAARELGLPRVALASSTTVYLGALGDPWREDMPLPLAAPFPVIAYKKMMELMADHYAGRTGLNVISLRIPLVYGPLYRSLNSFVSRLVHAAVQGVPGPLPTANPHAPPAYADDENWNLCYVTDCAEAIVRLQLAPALAHKIYNIGGAANVTNQQIADALRAVVPQARLTLQPGHSPMPPVAPLDLSRIEAEVGWTPHVSLADGIADYVAWLRAGNPQ